MSASDDLRAVKNGEPPPREGQDTHTPIVADKASC